MSSIDEKTIKAVEAVLAKGYAVELRPVKDGVGERKLRKRLWRF